MSEISGMEEPEELVLENSLAKSPTSAHAPPLSWYCQYPLAGPVLLRR